LPAKVGERVLNDGGLPYNNAEPFGG
jgi:hypothetical protein